MTKLLISVRNPVAATGGERSGMGIALDNIRERLTLLYGDRAGIATGREGHEFVVQLRLPLTDEAQEPI